MASCVLAVGYQEVRRFGGLPSVANALIDELPGDCRGALARWSMRMSEMVRSVGRAASTLLRENKSKIEEVHYENQAFVVHGDPGYHHNGVRPALGTATVSHSIFAGPLGLTDLDGSHDAYLHAHEGAHRYADGDVYAPACRGAHDRRLH